MPGLVQTHTLVIAMTLTSVFSSFSSFKYSQNNYVDVPKNSDVSANDSATRERSAEGVALSYSQSSTQSSELTYRSKADVSNANRPEASSSDSEPRTAAANTILGFIAGRLRLDVAEGASQADLSSRLQAGLQGFVQGYNEAYQQLEEMGFLYEGVEAAIEQTFSDVIDGLAALTDELGLGVDEVESLGLDDLREAQSSRRENYQPIEQNAVGLSKDIESELAAPAEVKNQVSSQTSELSAFQQISSKIDSAVNREAENLKSLIEASAYEYRKDESRRFNFALETQDGDRVTIRAAYASSALLEGTSVSYGLDESETFTGQFKVANGFYLDVQGELDADELLAIEDVLTQVREVSDLFFSGDIESAFNRAVDMGFNSQEIAEFSLRLRYQRVETYGENAGIYSAPKINNASDFDGLRSTMQNEVNALLALSEQDESLKQLARFVQALEDMRMKFDSLMSTDEPKGLRESENALGGSASSAPTRIPMTEKASGSVAIVGELMTALNVLQSN